VLRLELSAYVAFHFSSASGISVSVGKTCAADIRTLPQTLCGFAAGDLRGDADAGEDHERHSSSMRRSSYAVWWREGNGPRHVGKVEIARLHALLSGGNAKRVAVPFDDITAVEYQRGEVRIDRRAAATLSVGSLDAPGVLLELTNCLAAVIPLLQ
jgi:hypothetical protein